MSIYVFMNKWMIHSWMSLIFWGEIKKYGAINTALWSMETSLKWFFFLDVSVKCIDRSNSDSSIDQMMKRVL